MSEEMNPGSNPEVTQEVLPPVELNQVRKPVPMVQAEGIQKQKEDDRVKVKGMFQSVLDHIKSFEVLESEVASKYENDWRNFFHYVTHQVAMKIEELS